MNDYPEWVQKLGVTMMAAPTAAERAKGPVSNPTPRATMLSQLPAASWEIGQERAKKYTPQVIKNTARDVKNQVQQTGQNLLIYYQAGMD